MRIKRNQSLTSQVLHTKPDGLVFSIRPGPPALIRPAEVESGPGPLRHRPVLRFSEVYSLQSSQRTAQLELRFSFQPAASLAVGTSRKHSFRKTCRGKIRLSGQECSSGGGLLCGGQSRNSKVYTSKKKLGLAKSLRVRHCYFFDLAGFLFSY